MAAGQEIYAQPGVMAHVGEEALVSEATMAHMTGLVGAQQAYANAETLHAGRLAEIAEAMKALGAEQESLLAGRENLVSREDTLRSSHLGDIMDALRDPASPIHEIYRAVLLGPEQDYGSLWYANTLAIADEFGRSIVTLDNALRQQRDSQPVAKIRYTYDLALPGYRSVRMNFGQTLPGLGMEPHLEVGHTGPRCTCGALHTPSRPFLEIPVEVDTIGAVQTQGNTYTASLASVSAEDAANASLSPYRRWDPTLLPLTSPDIVIPTGNFHDRDHLFATYDDSGEVTHIYGPTKLRVGERSYSAIGEQAVTRALFDVYENAVLAGNTEPAVRDLTRFVGAVLGLTIRRSDFPEA